MLHPAVKALLDLLVELVHKIEELLYQFMLEFNSELYTKHHQEENYNQVAYFSCVAIGIVLLLIYVVSWSKESKLASVYYFKYKRVLDRAQSLETLRRKINAKLLYMEQQLGLDLKHPEVQKEIGQERLDMEVNLIVEGAKRAKRLYDGHKDKIAEQISEDLEAKY